MEISETKDGVICKADAIKPGIVYLKFPSVGATENVMLASSLTPEKTTILNAAMEPEIVNLAQYLKSIGVKIFGEGTDKITVIGTNTPTDGEVTVIPDRIVASTYMISAFITKGKVVVNSVCPPHFSPVVAVLRKMGAHVETFQNRICAEYLEELKNIPYLATGPYPGFPTDAQPLLVSLMCLSRGLGIVKESIFENRLGHCLSLNSMGANIEIKGRYAFINGVDFLKPASVYASDLRCGAALCLAALSAEGVSYVSGTEFIDRGYENICRDLKSLGASIERIE